MKVSRRSPLVAAACFAIAVLAAGCTSNNSSPTTTAPSCSFSVTQPATTTFGPDGGTGSATIAAGSGCAWTATSSASFLTITQGATGTSNGSVTFTVAANAGATDRTATLAIAGTNIIITQRAASTPPPTGTLSAPSAKSPIGGAFVDPGRPALVVNNAESTGSVGAVTYRFEISDTSTFPVNPVRNFTQDGVVQGSGTTSWVVNHDLGPNVLWYWHALATNGTLTTAYSATETFSTASPCVFTVSPASTTAAGAGGTGTITVTTSSACAWVAASNASFITVTAGSSGVGSGTVTYSAGANSSGAVRSGTLTVAGQTVTIIQSAGGGLTASFQMFDPSTQASATTECRFRNANTPALPTTCVLQSTSLAAGTSTIVSYGWTVQYTYNTIKIITGSSPTLAITDICGTPPNTAATTDGVAQPLSVALTVVDNLGATATATTGTGSQPALNVRLYQCGS